MKSFFLFLIIVVIVISSCFKRNEANVNAACTDSCMSISARVTTGLNSGEPVGNAGVELGWAKGGTPWGDPGRLIARGHTGNDGLIHFSFKAKQKELQGGYFYLTASKGSDYFVQRNQYYGIKKYDSIVNANVHMPGKATLKIVFKNFHPASPEDFFQCIPGFYSYGSDPLSVPMYNSNGEQSNTFFFHDSAPFNEMVLTGTTAGNQYTHFSITRKKNGIREDLRDSIYIASGQLGVYEVVY